jgi:hypothetical protein
MLYASIIAAALVYIKSRRDIFTACLREMSFRFFIRAASFVYSDKYPAKHVSLCMTTAYGHYLPYYSPSQVLVSTGTWRKTIIIIPFANASPNSSGFFERCPLLLAFGAGQNSLYE